MLQPINKHTVLKEVRQNGIWQGYIAPNNVNSYHIKGGWHIGVNIKIELAGMHDRPSKYIVTTHGERVDLDKYLNTFECYNCNSELGKRIRFWQ